MVMSGVRRAWSVHGQCTGDARRMPGSPRLQRAMSAIACCFKYSRVIFKDRQGVSVHDIVNCDVSFTPSHVLEDARGMPVSH